MRISFNDRMVIDIANGLNFRDPRAVAALNFLKKNINSETIDADGMHDTLFAINEGIGAELKLTTALFWYFCGNAEKAAMLASQAYFEGIKDKTSALLAVACFLDSLDALEPMPEYMAKVKWKSARELCFEYRNKAADFLAHDDLVHFDHCLMRRMALMADESKMQYVKECVAKSLEMGMETTVAEWRKHVAETFTPETVEATHRNAERWAVQVNKRYVANFLANFMCNIIYTDTPSIIDFGCHAGTLGGMIRDYSDKRLTYIGIDRDENPIEMAKMTYPELEFVQGGHEKLLDLDMECHILLLSFVCCLNPPETMEAIADYANRRTKYVVLVEDVSNMNGDFAVFRRHYLLHPYGRIFRGFRMIHRETLPNPNPAANALLMYRNPRRL